MQKSIIDLSKCKSIGDIHEVIKTALDFPDYYGKNLSALWDCLTGHIDYPITIIIKGVDDLNQHLQNDALKILQIFIRAEEEIPEIHIVTSKRMQP